MPCQPPPHCNAADGGPTLRNPNLRYQEALDEIMMEKLEGGCASPFVRSCLCSFDRAVMMIMVLLVTGLALNSLVGM